MGGTSKKRGKKVPQPRPGPAAAVGDAPVGVTDKALAQAEAALARFVFRAERWRAAAVSAAAVALPMADLAAGEGADSYEATVAAATAEMAATVKESADRADNELRLAVAVATGAHDNADADSTAVVSTATAALARAEAALALAQNDPGDHAACALAQSAAQQASAAAAAAFAAVKKRKDAALESLATPKMVAPPRVIAPPPATPAIEDGHTNANLRECVVCFSDVRTSDLYLAAPCGHRSTCDACVLTLRAAGDTKCPVCRVPALAWCRVFDV